MKKFLFLTLILSGILSTTIYAQGGVDQATMLQQMKDKFKPQMVEKTGLTEAQVDKVLEINLEIRMASKGLRELSEADRTAKLAEMKATKEKKYSEIPLTPEQIKSVYTFFEDMGKNAPPKPGN